MFACSHLSFTSSYFGTCWGGGNENIPSSLIIVSQFGSSSGLLFMQISLASSVPSISLPSRSVPPASALQTSACPHASLTAYLAGHSDVPCTPAESLWLWSFSNAGPSMMLRQQPGKWLKAQTELCQPRVSPGSRLPDALGSQQTAQLPMCLCKNEHNDASTYLMGLL